MALSTCTPARNCCREGATLAACPRPALVAMATAAQRHPPRQQVGRCRTMPAAAEPPAASSVFEWTWAKSKSARPAAAAEAGLPAADGSAKELVAAFVQLAEQGAVPPDHWMAAALSALQPQLPALPAADLTKLLAALAALGCAPAAGWSGAALGALGAQLPKLSGRPLAQALWAASELGAEPSERWLTVAHDAVAAYWQDFLAPDLATALCAVASFDPKPSAAWVAAAAEEARFQLTEFMADFTPTDLARLISGLAELGVEATPELRMPLMKAVYTNLKTISDKAAVDFALAKLEAGQRSMHYDPRWTHEELSWLPRRERDKRRILKDGWYRTKWTGWTG